MKEKTIEIPVRVFRDLERSTENLEETNKKLEKTIDILKEKGY